MRSEDAVERAVAFLERSQLPSGELRVLASGKPDPSLFPTALAACALSFAPRAANVRSRNLRGLFYTWKLTLAQLRHPLVCCAFFAKTSAKPFDVDAVVNANALEHALAVCALRHWNRPSDVGPLLTLQLESGAWPAAPLYHGGRARRRDGTFAAPHPDTPRWGSAELTTAFCIEALARGH